ncbi:c-type cytochrome [Frateuria aurantia]
MFKMHRLPAVAALLMAVTAASAATTTRPDLVARGAYMARAADCVACHTAPGGQPFGGGYGIVTPFGKIFGSNISSDPTVGIGTWTDAQFLAAVKHGIGKQGENLYPAMPYDSFQNMTDEDVLAIKAYLMSLPAVKTPSPGNQLHFPFDQRWLLTAWKLISVPRPIHSDSRHDAQWNRGRYLVEGAAHCETCHTPRNLAMGMSTSHAFAGGDLGSWYAYNITPDIHAGIGGWSDQELLAYLHEGNAPGRGAAAGPMAEAVEHSLQYLTTDDLRAMITYLRSVPAQGASTQASRSRQGQPDQDYAILRGASRATLARHPGAELYLQHCASCHAADGSGKGQGAQAYPSLYHQSTVGAEDTTNLVSVILNGVDRHIGDQHIYMPAIGQDLSNPDVALLANYVAERFGRPNSSISAGRVAQLRNPAVRPHPVLPQ